MLGLVKLSGQYRSQPAPPVGRTLSQFASFCWAPAAITDGDWVVVRSQEDAENGDIVAAMFEGHGEEGEATVKTLKRGTATCG